MVKEDIDYTYYARKLIMQLKVYYHPFSQELFDFLKTNGKSTVTKLQDHFGLSQSFLSQRLAKLRMLGFLSTERKAKNVYYFNNNKKIELVHHSLRTYFQIQ